MKKIFLLFGFVLLSLMIGGCTKKPNLNDTVKVLIPSGAPTLGFVKMIYEEEKISGYNVLYDITSGPEELTVGITSKSHQIVVAPTNLGANLYNKNSNYVYAGAVSFGNLFLISNEDVKLYDLQNKKITIAVFGKNSVPDIILRKVLTENNIIIDSENVTLEYFSSVNDVLAQFKAGKYKYVVLAEPVLSNASSDSYIVSDLQEEYKKITNNDSYPQAGIFISKDFFDKNKEFVSKFLSEVKESIDFVNNNKDKAADYYIEKDLKPTLNKETLIKSIPNSNLRFESAVDSKTKVNDYLQMIYDFNSKAIGDKMPDDNFYLSE